MAANLVDFEGNLEALLTEIKSHSGLVVVKFGSTTCMPCKRLRQVLPSIAKDNASAYFMNVEIGKEPEIGKHFEISSVPTTILFKGVEGDQPKQVSSIIGLKLPEIKAAISQNI